MNPLQRHSGKFFSSLAQQAKENLSGIQFGFPKQKPGFRVRAKARPGMTSLFTTSTAYNPQARRQADAWACTKHD